jgi:hypothetical protein
LAPGVGSPHEGHDNVEGDVEACAHDDEQDGSGLDVVESAQHFAVIVVVLDDAVVVVDYNVVVHDVVVVDNVVVVHDVVVVVVRDVVVAVAVNDDVFALHFVSQILKRIRICFWRPSTAEKMFFSLSKISFYVP